jgi:F-type H+-transporting ATPase subunit b
MLALDLQQIISQVLSFLLLLWVLRRFAWRPLLGVLDARRARIEEQLREAARHQEEAARLQQDLAARLAAIDQEARVKIQQAIQEGRRMAAEVQEDARAQAQQILAKSKETIELELAKAKVTLRDELADLTAEAVHRLLRQTLDEKTDHRLIAAILEELGSPSEKP